ncbi:unnamed protein product [Rhizophagus irregularis]|nr:unnamed protein product [Rhizophagus irregularis]
MSSQDDIICESCNTIYSNIGYKWCKQCGINNLKENFINWTSGNEEVDNFIQKMQLKIESFDDIIVEWIPYNQFNNVKKTNKDNFATAISWKDGLLEYNKEERKHIRISNTEVSLKCLNNSQSVINEISNEDKYSTRGNLFEVIKISGISQNSDTKIILYGNEKIDEFIQEMQLKIERYDDIIVEWIPYNQFNNVKKIGKDDFAIAIWKNGSLEYNNKEIKYERKPNIDLTLKCLNNSQNDISDLLNELKHIPLKELIMKIIFLKYTWNISKSKYK